MTVDLDEARRMLAASDSQSKHPWTFDARRDCVRDANDEPVIPCEEATRSDSLLIASAPTLIAAMADEIDELRARPLRDHEKASVFAVSVYEDAVRSGRIDRDPALVAGEMAKVLTTAEATTSEHRDRLRWGVVANAGRLSAERRPRWAHVKAATGFGSTSAQALCRDAGFDPDEDVGGEAPYVCPGCHAVGGERCAPGCIDDEIESERRHAIESGEYDDRNEDEETTDAE